MSPYIEAKAPGFQSGVPASGYEIFSCRHYGRASAELSSLVAPDLTIPHFRQYTKGNY